MAVLVVEFDSRVHNDLECESFFSTFGTFDQYSSSVEDAFAFWGTTVCIFGVFFLVELFSAVFAGFPSAEFFEVTLSVFYTVVAF